ncbi:MAG: c-type cytochrome [Pollutimonas bauzanensis]
MALRRALRREPFTPGLRLMAAGLLAAAACALLWPAAYAAAAAPAEVDGPGLASLVLASGGAWFPPWDSLWTLSPDWPLPWRPDSAIPVSSHAVGQLWRTLIVGALLVLAGAAAAFLKGGRRLAAVLAGAALFALLPRPHPELLLAPATPATFRQPQAAFSAAGILAGQHLYEQACLQCHGKKADGQGPLAAQLATWPSVLGPALFRNRHAGDLYWSILQGGEKPLARHAFGPQLAQDEAWKILDYLRASAAGQEMRQSRGWRQAVAAPQMALSCRKHAVQELEGLRGSLVRIVAYSAGGIAPLPDPRVLTIALAPGLAGPRALPESIDCLASSAQAWQAYALVAGSASQDLAGAQFLVDRQGWLRSLWRPGDPSGWTLPESMCLPASTAAPQTHRGAPDLLRRIDATEVETPRFRSQI